MVTLHTDEALEALDALLAASARRLVANEDAAAFTAWLVEQGASLAPALWRELGWTADALPRALAVVASELLALLPTAGRNYRAGHVARPGRNEPCPCGSGRKYKQCCREFAETVPCNDYNLLGFVLDALPAHRFGELARAHPDLDAVLDTVDAWRADGQVDRACALLEAWFESDDQLAGASAPLLEALMDCHATRGDGRASWRLAERIAGSGDHPLAALAWSLCGENALGAGDEAAARQAHAEAVRHAPDDPAHAILELRLLVRAGDETRAARRAARWRQECARLDEDGLEGLDDFLAAVERGPRAAVAALELRLGGALQHLDELLQAAPEPALLYDLRPRGAASELVPQPPLAAAEQAWRRHFHAPKPAGQALALADDAAWDGATGWLDLLAAEPLAWHSLDVLEDLVFAAERLDDDLDHEAFGRTLTGALALRALTVVETLVGDGTPVPLPWQWLPNRPLLRLVAFTVERLAALEPARRGPAETALLATLETWLQAFDPSDPLGFGADGGT